MTFGPKKYDVIQVGIHHKTILGSINLTALLDLSWGQWRKFSLKLVLLGVAEFKATKF